jgi:hypothetical protein
MSEELLSISASFGGSPVLSTCFLGTKEIVEREQKRLEDRERLEEGCDYATCLTPVTSFHT